MQTNKTLFFLNIFILWLGHYLVDFMIGIWPVYKTLAQLDLAKAGLIGGACAFAGEGMQIVFGSLSDKGYQKYVISFGLLATIASLFFTHTTDYLFVFALYLMTCIGSGAFHPTATGILGGMNSQRKGLLISIFFSGGALGLASSQLIFTQAHAILENKIVLLGLPTIALALFSYFFYLANLPSEKKNESKKIDFAVFLQFFKHRELRLLYLSQVCNATILWGMMFLLPDILQQRHYEPWIAYGGGHLMFILGVALMSVPAGFLADKYSSKSVMMASAVIGVTFLYAFIFFPQLSSTTLLFILFILGAGLGISSPVAIALGTSLAPNHRGMVSAFLMGMVWCVSEGLGQVGGGAMTKLFVHDAAAMALALLGSLFVVNLIACRALSRESKLFEYA